MMSFPVPLALRCIIVAGVWLAAAQASAQMSLDVLARSGYGMVSIKRPQPNALTVLAEVNGRSVKLVMDTGYSGDGLALDSAYAGSLGLNTESIKGGGISASGRKIAFRKSAAESVVLGNAHLRGVPLFFGIFQGLRDQETRRSIGAEGFLGAGFLRTCSAVVDLHNLRLYLRPPGTGRRVAIGPALQGIGFAEAPFTQTAGGCLVDVEINGAKGKMIVDTGATLGGVDNRFASQMKVSGYNSYIGMVDAAGVTTETQMTWIRSFKIGGSTARAPHLLLNKFDAYSSSGGKVIGILGIDILGPNGAIIDFGQQKLYFFRAKDAQ